MARNRIKAVICASPSGGRPTTRVGLGAAAVVWLFGERP